MGLGSAGAQLISIPATGSSSRHMGTPFQPPCFRIAASPLPFRKCRNKDIWKWKGKRGKVCYSVEGVKDNEIDDEGCELVSGMELSIGEQLHHSIPAYLFKAVKNNNGTAILLLSDLFAFQHSSIRDFAYRLACNGFNVLLPDLIHGDPWEKQPEQLSAKREMQRIAEDIGIITKWLVDEFSAAGISRKLGIMGFGYGGGRVIDVLAQDEGACFSIGASLYGTEVDPSVASKVKVPVLLISGDNDPLCPVSVMKDLEKGMGEGSKLVIFEGRGHGFVHNPGSPEEDEDAEQAFLMLRNWLHHGLVATNI